MAGINPIILEGLSTFFDGSSDVPKGMKVLVEKLLQTETNEHVVGEGIDKIYDQILEKFINDAELVEWSKNYVGQ